MTSIVLLTFEQAEATMYAALLAASVASLAALLTYFNSRKAEVRASQRKLLERSIPKLGTALQEIVATSVILLKTRTSESRKSWDRRGNVAKTALLQCQKEMRYSLWGITDSFRTLSRLPSWAQHAMRHPAKAATIVGCGDALSRAIDHTVLASLRTGKPPGWWRRFLVWRRTKKLLTAYRQFRRMPRGADGEESRV
jgi:hypothetical protein